MILVIILVLIAGSIHPAHSWNVWPVGLSAYLNSDLRIRRDFHQHWLLLSVSAETQEIIRWNWLNSDFSDNWWWQSNKHWLCAVNWSTTKTRTLDKTCTKLQIVIQNQSLQCVQTFTIHWSSDFQVTRKRTTPRQYRSVKAIYNESRIQNPFHGNTFRQMTNIHISVSTKPMRMAISQTHDIF